MLLIYATGIKVKWIAKDSLFRGPMGVLIRALGGIEVNRRQRSNFVDQIVKILNQHDHLIIALAPEGTRTKANHWKTGFYYIALGARVPIAMGFIDYEKKVVGIGPYFYPSGDIQSDFDTHIKVFYSDKIGKYPDKQGAIRLDDRSKPASN
jgi:1-acyl-sn-glycerol-3-phosphate acyltransferase